MIFIGYEDNRYHFICHTQGNTIFCSTHAIFDEEYFSKYTNSYTKEHKLYDELLDKTSSETELLASDPSGKDGPAPVPILHTSIPPTSLYYKSISLPPTPRPKKPTVKIEETNNVDSNVEMQPPSPQQHLQPSLQIPQEDSELRRSKHQT